jgi:protein gp37
LLDKLRSTQVDGPDRPRTPRLAARFNKPGRPFEGITFCSSTGPRWTGKVRVLHKALVQPLNWEKPRRVVVNSMSELFHERVPDEFINNVFHVMNRATQHQYRILTKRSRRLTVAAPRLIQ